MNLPIRTAIRLAMKRAGVSTSQLAREAGVHRGNLSMFLNGKRDTSVETLDKVMKALGLAIKPK